MVRNKSQGREGLTDNRRGNQGDKMTNDRATRGQQSNDEELRENAGKDNKNTHSRKGSPGKQNQ